MTGTAERFTGASIRRSEDPRILTGQGRYVDDVQLPGMLHAAFVRSPFPHARITSVDTTAALSAPGVVAVYTGAEMEELVSGAPSPLAMMAGGKTPPFTLLATNKARLVGDPVAMVVAESRYLAEDACELVEVDYNPLPPVPDAATALDPSSTPVFDEHETGNIFNSSGPNLFGDVDAAFANADHVLTTTIALHRHQNVPMECRGIVASYDADSGELTAHCATQGVMISRMILSSQLGLGPDKVHILAGDIGGSFGLKIGAGREEIAAAAASKALARPVKWTEDRNENLTVSGQAREESFEVEAAYTDAGDILGMRVKMVIDTGAYPGMGGGLGGMIQGMLPGPYKLGALSFESRAVITNKASYIAYRGPWAAETMVRERVIDLIARELGMEPHAVRMRNVVTRGEAPLNMVTGRSLAGVTAKESLERMAQHIDIPAFRQRQEAARAEGRYLGLGLGTYIEAAPGPRQEGGGGIMGAEQMRMRVEKDGTISVFTAQMPHGQGHQTTLAQIAADEFGVPFESVNVVVGNSDLAPMGFGTGGSRSATMAGGASLHNARALRAKVLDVASHLIEAGVEDMDITDGMVGVRGVPARAMTLAQIADAVDEPGRLPEGVDGTLEVSNPFDGGEGGWAGGTHGCIVEVDVETGLVNIERYVVVEDCGELINPAIVEGQVRGGVAQGIGAVLLERSAYDGEGQFLAGTMMDYLLPTAHEIPTIEIDHLETVPLDADVNFRGVGEGGMVVSPVTVCNAIEDALAHLGVRIREQHLPPTKLLELLGTIEPDPSRA